MKKFIFPVVLLLTLSQIFSIQGEGTVEVTPSTVTVSDASVTTTATELPVQPNLHTDSQTHASDDLASHETSSTITPSSTESVTQTVTRTETESEASSVDVPETSHDNQHDKDEVEAAQKTTTTDTQQQDDHDSQHTEPGKDETEEVDTVPQDAENDKADMPEKTTEPVPDVETTDPVATGVPVNVEVSGQWEAKGEIPGEAKGGVPGEAKGDIPGEAKGEIPVEGVPTEEEEKVELRVEESDGEKGEEDHHDFQSYSEWRKKVLEEEEKSKQDNTANIPPAPQGSATKQKLKINFSSKNCGAKVLTANQEAENVQGVLTANKDEYMLNPCGALKKWFTVELCEPVQLKTVEIASLELFSSQPKTFKLFLSDRFPAKEWREAGEWQARQEKVPQGFPVDDQQFVKFIKVELLDHYGTEHFCPVTLFRVYGIPMADDDDDEAQENPQTTNTDEDSALLQDGEEDTVKENSRNLFMSAKDTVMNLVKKVLNVEEKEKGEGEKGEDVVLEANYSIDGYPLPCVPLTDEEPTEKPITDSVPSTAVPSPDSSIPPTQKAIPIVTKLLDDEQPPSEHDKAKMVTLMASENMTPLELCNGSSVNNHSHICPHRMVCSYVQTMLSNKIEQSCYPHMESDQPTVHQPSIPATERISTETSVVKEKTETSRDQSMLSTSSVVSHTSTESQSVMPQEPLKEETDSVMEKKIDEVKDKPDVESVSSSQVMTSSDTPVSEPPESTLTETSTVETVTKSEEQAPVLEPSSNSVLEEETNTFTETPVLETQQSESLPAEQPATVKVTPSPSVPPSDDLPMSATSIKGNRAEDGESKDVEERKDSGDQREMGESKDTGDSEVVEVLKANNETVVKDTTIELVHVPLAPVAKRETAIMRLTNRIKALELNVSLSSRFLDELSHRFKKQSEDMMRLLNKTIAHFTNVTNKAEARDMVQQQQLDKLEVRVENLTLIISQLSLGMEQLNTKIVDRQLVWSSVELVLLAVVCVVCLRRGSGNSLHPEIRTLLENMPQHPAKKRRVERRNSVGVVGHVAPSSVIKKQASDTALASSSDSVPPYEVVEQKDPLLPHQPAHKDGSKKKKKKKHKNLESKSSVVTNGGAPDSDTMSLTKLTKSAGLLFGTDAVTVLTGVADPLPNQDKQSPHKSSTKSLPTHSRQGSQTSTEIQNLTRTTTVPTQKPSHCSSNQPDPKPPDKPVQTVTRAQDKQRDKHDKWEQPVSRAQDKRDKWEQPLSRVGDKRGIPVSRSLDLTNGTNRHAGHMWKSMDYQSVGKGSVKSTAHKSWLLKKSNGVD